MTENITLASRLAGAVWGHLVGDAVGVPYEFGPARPAASVVFGATGAHGQPPGTWSDDGALMLALLDSLRLFNSPVVAGPRGAWRGMSDHLPPKDAEHTVVLGTVSSRSIRRSSR